MLSCIILLFIVFANGFKWDKVPLNAKYLPRYQSSDVSSVNAPDNDLECKVRTLAYQYGLKIQPFRSQQKTYDALNINHYCKNNDNNNLDISPDPIYHINSDIIDSPSASVYTVYVDPQNGNDNNNGSITAPFLTIYRGLNSVRSKKSNILNKQIIIRTGMIYLSSSIILSPDTFDSNLLIRSYPNENVTISGGVLLNNTNINWERYDDGNKSHNIWMTQIDNKLLFNNTILSLFTLSPHTRLTRSRYPNGEVDVFNNGNYYINPYKIDTWWVLPADKSQKPIQSFKDLSNCSTTKPCLPYSSNAPYDTYTAGHNGLCSLWNHPDCRFSDCWSYWCGENCHGGWAGEDQRMSTEGIRQLPIGMTFNRSVLSELETMDIDDDTILHIKHSQGWNVFFYSIDSNNQYFNLKSGNISLGHGGWQGGRVWTKTHDLNQNAVTNLPIMGGPMYFDNIFNQLDTKSEWYYNRKTSVLYYWPNNTSPGQPPPKDINLVIGNLSNLFTFVSSDHQNPLFNVTIQDINFRDTRYTYMDRWFTPSGGDWGFYRGGALFFENVTNSTIKGCYFNRLDGNVITLSGYTRNITLYRNEFGYIGDNVMGAVGFTDQYDGTNGLQPRYTYIIQNYVYHIGLYQLQSSFWFQARSCLSYIYDNIVFNIPRAAVLFNDAFGGGNEVGNNLMFNTCTESGDHGPINSWNRMPFMTKVAHGVNSYDAMYTNVYSNFIFANFGGSQAFDTDDGSAWYNMYGNFFYCALAYKNDYGGYNVNYWNNLNVAWTWDGPQNCWGVGGVKQQGPANNLTNNTCIVYGNTRPQNVDFVGQFGNPNTEKNSPMKLYNNKYYTLHGNATIIAGDGSHNSIPEMQKKYNLEEGSTYSTLPSNDDIITWAKDILNM